MARYIKKGIKDPRFQYPNRYILSQIVGTQYDIIPYKGTKGVADAQPINEANMADIEDALVNIDTDLAFIEADYINAAEHALKQDKTDNALTTSNKTVVGAINELVTEKQDKTDNNLDTSDKTVVGAINEVVSEKQDKTDNALNTTNKTVVGAINEVKSDSEYYDAVQDDAIAIINNKVNALPMNGSLKNIRTSTVGIPTTLTNIDMFNTKQTVTNYQPLSLDYKGAAEPHVVVMKTIGDYIFDFAIEAAHTNGTDTTITLEAWVDGVLYDTATRTLVGGSNQVNGITGFFSYSKGTDTVPSEIYFKFKASQGNTSANKAMINTNLQGNSATMSFTDTDHVTGISLNEPTYLGATTSFIINDLDTRVDTKVNKSGDTMTGGLSFGSNVGSSPTDVTKQLTIHDAGSLGKYGIGVTADNMNYVAPNSGQKHNFLVNGITRATIAETITQPKDLITKEYADFNYKNVLNDVFLGYDDSLHATHLLQDILKDIIVKAQVKLKTEEPFIIKFSTDDTTNSPNLNAKLREYILEKNGVTIPYTNLDFKIESSTTNGQAYYNSQAQTKVTVWNREYCFSFEFDYDSWSANKVTNENLKQDWSLDELGLDGTWSLTDVPGNIKKAVDKVVSLIGNKTTFTITQPLYRDSTSTHYEFSQAIEDSIVAGYGKGIGTTGFEFRLTMGLYNGTINQSGNLGNFIEIIGNNTGNFTRLYNYTNWANGKWLDEVGSPHADIACEIESYMSSASAYNIDVPYRDYISGITVWVGDYESDTSEWSAGDANVRYIPRARPKTAPPNAIGGNDGDTLFAPVHSMLSGTASPVNPIAINQIANMYFKFDYAASNQTYPNGICITGELTNTHIDNVVAMIVIHYGNINWTNDSQQLNWASKASFTPALLDTLEELPRVETPNMEPGNE